MNALRCFNKKMLVAATASVVLGMGMAQAVPMTTFWFEGYGGFLNNSHTDGLDSNATSDWTSPTHYAAPAPIPSTFHHFGWAADGVHSHLTINELPPYNDVYQNIVNDSITVSDPKGTVMGWLTHHNEVISDWFGPDAIQVNYQLKVFSDAGKTNLVWDSGVMNFMVDLMETRNDGAGGGGVCRDNDGGETGNDTGNSTPCPDDIRFALGTNPHDPAFGSTFFDPQFGNFSYGGYNYNVSLSGFWDKDGNLTGTFWSPEGGINTAFVRADIHVPEPGTVFLLGGGLAGLAFAARRRAAAKA